VTSKKLKEGNMAKYLYVYYGGMMAETPAQQKKSMDMWMAWFGKLGKSVVDAGAPTKPGKTVGKAGVRATGAANPVTGYSIVQAASLDAATEMAKGCSSIPEGGKIAVYELLPM
jgi:hypothetical protein